MIKETDKTQTPLVDFGEPVDMSKNIIKVVGVGGGGCNAVNNMYRSRINNVTFAVCNTDSQSLANSPVPVKLLLGSAGLGAGANPEIGRKEAEENLEGIKNLFNDGTRMVFVTAGMGGGTGTGAAPVVAGVAKSLGLLTVGIVTIPFYFEKKMKIVKALKGVEEMRKNVDALLIINNERLCDVYSDSPISVKDAFKRADDILDTAARSISELITIEGEMNLDFRDVEATMRGGGGAIMAMGRASGEKRVQAAVTNALESPLLYGRDITKAKRILFNIYTGEDAPLFVNEMNEIDAFMDSLDPNIEVIWGLSNDNTIGTDAKVTILATGLGDGWNDEAVNASIVNSDEYYDEIISKLYSRSKRNAQPVEIEEPKTEEVQEPHEDVSMLESEPAYDDDEEEEPADKPLPKVPNPVLEKLKLMVLKLFNE
jgi:cell division protein FtsZ